jgi:hypothetical protein
VAAITDVPHRGAYSRIGSAADDPNRNLGDMGNGCFVIIGENRHQDFAGQRHALHRNSRFSGHGRVWFRTVASDKSCRSDNPVAEVVPDTQPTTCNSRTSTFRKRKDRSQRYRAVATPSGGIHVMPSWSKRKAS